MNSVVKDSLNRVSKSIVRFFSDLSQSVVSLLRMIVLSSFRVALQSKKNGQLKKSETCCVLGNGPSLKDDFDKDRVKTEGKDLLCVNMFCSSPLFYSLKPRFYFLVDGNYFSPADERNEKLVDELISAFSMVDWSMNLIVSNSAVSGGKLMKNVVNNKNIKIIRLNSAEVNGYRPFRHWVYRHHLGMPRCQTVVNFALCAAINMGYRNIDLYGADHTWTRDLFVNENNEVCYGDRHLYNKNLTVVKKNCDFATLLIDFANMFKSHYLLEDYSKSVGVKIWNCSSDSFLDSYERKLF